MINDIITRGKVAKAPKIIVYGSEGIGKSTFAANAKNPIFIQTEDGLNHIDCAKFPLAKTFDDFNRYLDMITNEDHEFKTIVFDSADWLEKIIHKDICQKSGSATIELACGGYGKGYTQTKVEFEEILDKLEGLHDNGVTIIFVAHSKIDKFVDPESGQIDRFDIKLHDKTASLLKEWADCVFFATRILGTNKGEIQKNERIIKTTGNKFCVAKNRYNLPDTLPMSYPVVFGEIIKSIKS